MKDIFACISIWTNTHHPKSWKIFFLIIDFKRLFPLADPRGDWRTLHLLQDFSGTLIPCFISVFHSFLKMNLTTMVSYWHPCHFIPPQIVIIGTLVTFPPPRDAALKSPLFPPSYAFNSWHPSWKLKTSRKWGLVCT